MVSDEGFQALLDVHTALQALHEFHPDSRAADVLHGRLSNAVAANRELLTAEQFDALGGGTPKTPGS